MAVPVEVRSLSRFTELVPLIASGSRNSPTLTSGWAVVRLRCADAEVPAPELVDRAAQAPACTSCCCTVRPATLDQAARLPVSKSSPKSRVGPAGGALLDSGGVVLGAAVVLGAVVVLGAAVVLGAVVVLGVVVLGV